MVHKTNKRNGKKKSSIEIVLMLFFVSFIVLAATVITSGSVLAAGNDTTPPTVMSTSPSGTLNTGDVVLEVVTDENASCRYDDSDVAYSVMSSDFDDFGVVHNKSITVPDGDHTHYVRCSDSYGNEMNGSAIISYAVDSIPPTIIESFISPSGIVQQDYAELHVETDEEAVCRLDDEDKYYDDMDNLFHETGEIEHSHTLTGLDVGNYEYYVRCEDEAGNQMQASELLEFEVNLPPTAAISIEGGFHIKADTHKITLQTSEPLLTTPSLQYKYQGSGGRTAISLTGSGSFWIGYIVVPSYSTDQIGTFYFEGTDLSGLTGTRITSGEIFIVDTTKPPSPEDLRAEFDDDEIKLEWHYDGEEHKYFNIYRSTNEDVDFVDLYDEEVDEEYFTDDDIDKGKTYYYRVSTVDKAGNEGELSDEVHVEYGEVGEEELEESDMLSSSLEKQLNSTIRIVEKDILDLDWAISNLESMNDPLKVKIINKLDLVNKAKKAKDDVEAALADLDSWRHDALTKDQFNQKHEIMMLDIVRYKINVATKIDINNQVEYDQHYDEIALLSTMNEILKNIPLSDGKKKEYEDQSKSLQDKVLVKGSVASIEIFYMNRENGEELTLFEKRILANEPLENVLVVESIPKQVEEDASNIEFGTTPIIVNKDPIVKWSFSSVSNEEIYYFVGGDVDLNIAQTTRTFVFAQPPSADSGADSSDLDNDITGNVVGGLEKPEFSLNKFLIGFGIVVIMGLLVYYFYFMKIEEDYEDMAVKSKTTIKENSNLVYAFMTKIGNWFRPTTRIIPQQEQYLPRTERQITKESKKAEKVGSRGSVVEPKNYFHHRLEKAHFIADHLDFDEAFVMYQRLLDDLKEVKLPSQEKILVEKQANKLNSKLMLMSKVKEAHSCVDGKDIIRLNHLLDHIKPLLELVGEDNFETKLVRHGLESYKYFKDVSKSMDHFSFS